MSEPLLPIRRIAATLTETLRRTPNVILRAPTGSGKSTQVPRILREAGLLERGEVVILQPRRLAARLLAHRVAREMGEPVGETVGYQIRLEQKVSPRTEIRFVTEGLLLRQMTEDEDLAGIQALVFDEFHERNIYSDVCLARARQIQRARRPDLRIMVMSATLTTERLAAYLGNAPVLETEDRSYPVEVRYLAEPVFRKMTAVTEEAAAQAAAVIREGHAGHVLIFMPGAREIRQTIAALQGFRETRSIPAYPLFGDLPPAEQDRAVREERERKIIVATNVAETSLTIPGVGVVIDSGQARVARYEPSRGINTLLVEKISRASAEQRAGRAGRTQAGVAICLWSEKDHWAREEADTPEIQRVDLAELMLWIRARGDGEEMDWYEAPPADSRARAEHLLRDLGALRKGGWGLSETGRRMLGFPLHPRYAALLLAAAERGCIPAAALMAALGQGRDILLRRLDKRQERLREDRIEDEEDADVFLRMKAWAYAAGHGFAREACDEVGVHGLAAREAEQIFQQLLGIARRQKIWEDAGELRMDDVLPGDEARREALVECVLRAFSDHVGQRLGVGSRRFALVGGRRGDVARDSVVQKADLIIAGEIREVSTGRTGEVNVLLSDVMALAEATLEKLYADDFRQEQGAIFDESIRRVVFEKRTYFRDLLLRASPSGEIDEDAAALLLAREVREGRATLKDWNAEIDQIILRINTIARYMPEWKIPAFSEEDGDFLRQQVCHGAMSVKEIKDRPVRPVLQQWLSVEQWNLLDHYCPETVTLPNGRKKKLLYREDQPPLLAARIQELYDLKENIRVADGRLPVAYQLLAPNQRPVQITANLEEFWSTSYPAIRKELKGRYPKHEWR